MSDRLEQLHGFLKESPKDAFLHYAIATELLQLGRVEEAREGFEAVVRDFPDYVGTYYHLGKLYESLGLTEDAIQTFEKGIAAATFAKNHHALGELKQAWKMAHGLDIDDYDE